MKRGKFHLYLVYLVLATSAVTCVSFSRYSTSVCGTATATVAKPICVLNETSLSTQVTEPGQEAEQECYFTVSNFDDIGNLTETAMKYTLYIKPTVTSAADSGSPDSAAAEEDVSFTLCKMDSTGDSWSQLPENAGAAGPEGESGWYVYEGGNFGIEREQTDSYKIGEITSNSVGEVEVQFQVKVIAEQIQPE